MVISDQLNHATSIIDGIRLCKSMLFHYQKNNINDLERQLKTTDEKGKKFELIVTDGIF